MEDRDIVELYWRRDERALAETASRLDDYCLSIARSVLGDGEDARECVNDAYLAAWNAIPPHRPENLAPFVGKLTRRIAVNALEKRDAVKRGGGQGEVVLEELAECLPSGESVESRVESAKLERALRRFVGTLPPTDPTDLCVPLLVHGPYRRHLPTLRLAREPGKDPALPGP